MPGWSSGCAISAPRSSAKPSRPNSPGGIRDRRSIHGTPSTRRAARPRARRLRLQRDRAAGARQPDAGLGGQARRLQRRGRIQAELWRHSPYRRAPSQPVARSYRLLRPARRRRRASAVAAVRDQRPRSARSAAARLHGRHRAPACIPSTSHGLPSCALRNGRRPNPSSKNCSTLRSRSCATPAPCWKTLSLPTSIAPTGKQLIPFSPARVPRSSPTSWRAIPIACSDHLKSLVTTGNAHSAPDLSRGQGDAGQTARRLYG